MVFQKEQQQNAPLDNDDDDDDDYKTLAAPKEQILYEMEKH